MTDVTVITENITLEVIDQANLGVTIDPVNETVITLENTDIVLEVDPVSAPVITVSQGQGPSGSDISAYDIRIDQVDNYTLYRGEAQPGSLVSDSSWRISKITVVVDDITISYANASNVFDKIWNNRATYTYT